MTATRKQITTVPHHLIVRMKTQHLGPVLWQNTEYKVSDTKKSDREFTVTIAKEASCF